jgi:cytochrome c556
MQTGVFNMHKHLILTCAAAIAAGVALSPAPGGAHDGAMGVVKERMEAMKSIAVSLKAIKGELGKGAGYSAAEVRAQAEAIAGHGGSAMTDLFPPGSASGPSEARKEIWYDWAAFDRRAAELEAAAIALKSTAAPSKPPNQAFKRLVGACAACHKTYRAKR